MLKTANKIFHLQIITKGNNTIIRVHRWQKLGNILQVGRKRKSELWLETFLFAHRNWDVRSILLMIPKFEATVPVNEESELKRQLHKQALYDLGFSSPQLLMTLFFHLFGPRRRVWNRHAMAEAIHARWAQCLAGSGLRVWWSWPSQRWWDRWWDENIGVDVKPRVIIHTMRENDPEQAEVPLMLCIWGRDGKQ